MMFLSGVPQRTDPSAAIHNHVVETASAFSEAFFMPDSICKTCKSCKTFFRARFLFFESLQNKHFQSGFGSARTGRPLTVTAAGLPG